MMSVGIRARVAAVMEELQTAEGIIVVENRTTAGDRVDVDAGRQQLLRQAAGIDDDADLLDVKSVHLAWHTTDFSLGGEFSLRGLRHDNTMSWVDATLPEGKQQIMDQMTVIEESPGTGRLTGMRQPGPGAPVELWFYEMSRGRLEPLDVDYLTYVDALLAMKGVTCWQYLFMPLDLSAPEFRSCVNDLRQALRLLPELFPDHDYADLRARLDARLLPAN